MASRKLQPNADDSLILQLPNHQRDPRKTQGITDLRLIVILFGKQVGSGEVRLSRRDLHAIEFCERTERYVTLKTELTEGCPLNLTRMGGFRK